MAACRNRRPGSHTRGDQHGPTHPDGAHQARRIIFALPTPRPAPAVSFTTLEGKTLELASLRGQPVLVTFWATSCPHCIEDMAALSEMHRELGPRGLRIIGVAMP